MGSDDRLSKKIRNAQIQKIPYQLIIGDEELEKRTVTYREYGQQDSHSTTMNQFLEMLSKRIKSKN
jgi:threonyl-tRNA synthetase